MFATNGAHNVVHLLIGLVMLIASRRTERASVMTMHVFGALYALLAVIGFASIGDEGHAMLMNTVHINGADNWLHAFLAIALFGSALLGQRTHRVVHTSAH